MLQLDYSTKNKMYIHELIVIVINNELDKQMGKKINLLYRRILRTVC